MRAAHISAPFANDGKRRYRFRWLSTAGHQITDSGTTEMLLAVLSPASVALRRYLKR